MRPSKLERFVFNNLGFLYKIFYSRKIKERELQKQIEQKELLEKQNLCDHDYKFSSICEEKTGGRFYEVDCFEDWVCNKCGKLKQIKIGTVVNSDGLFAQRHYLKMKQQGRI